MSFEYFSVDAPVVPFPKVMRNVWHAALQNILLYTLKSGARSLQIRVWK
jgi:hypothetical protein